MMPSFASDTVRVRRPSVMQDRGKDVLDYSDTADCDVPGCIFQPVASSANWADAEHPVSIQAVCFMPAGTVVSDRDLVEHGGAVYVVDGEPKAFKSPTGRVSNIQCELARWEP